MQHSKWSRTRRGIRRAALVLAAGLGPGAIVLPHAAGAGVHVDPAGAFVEDRAAVQRLVVAESVRNGAVPAPLALAVVEVESGFVPRTVSASGAIGLMQILPAVAEREFAVEPDALFDPVTNLRIGLGRLARLNDRYDGDWELALSHFRGGALEREGGRDLAHGYTLAYVERVMRGWRRYRRDPLVRAWVREAGGAPRFVAAEPPARLHAQPPIAWTDPAVRGESAAVEVRPHHRHRVHGRRPAEPCDGTNGSCGPAGRRFGDRGGVGDGRGGRWTAIEGGPTPAYRSRGGRWVPVTGAARFR